jgi:hypothetical protein
MACRAAAACLRVPPRTKFRVRSVGSFPVCGAATSLSDTQETRGLTARVVVLPHPLSIRGSQVWVCTGRLAGPPASPSGTRHMCKSRTRLAVPLEPAEVMCNTKSRPVFNGIRDPWYCAKMLEAFNPVWNFRIVVRLFLVPLRACFVDKGNGFQRKVGRPCTRFFLG